MSVMTDVPKANTSREQMESTVELEGLSYDMVREGLATILNQRKVPVVGTEPKSEEAGSTQQTVFYNPIQQFNRDLSVLAIRIFGDDLAKIRKTRHERRLQELAKKGTRGKKRKRFGPDTLKDSVVLKGEESQETDGGQVDRKVSDKESGNHEAAEKSSDGANCNLIPTTTIKQSVGADIDSSADRLRKSLDYQGIPKGPKNLARHSKNDSNNQEPMPHGHSFRILDALSATGLRALRYAKEIPLVTSVTANDLSCSATASITNNVRHNKLSDKINVINQNALTHMYAVGSGDWMQLPDGTKGRYDVIDLDPYGTAAPFLDAAVQALYDGGLLCVTCTDSGVFASVGYAEKTYAQYGGIPFKGLQSHEAGLRLILHAVATSAARHGFAIEPILSLSIDFYARVFVRIRRSQADAKFLAGKTMLVYNCDSGCGAWTTQFLANNKGAKNKNDEFYYKHTISQAPTTGSRCEHCGFKTHLSGPMWGGPLHNPYFVQKMLDELPSLNEHTYATKPRIEGMLTMALDETLFDPTHATNSDTSNASGSKPSSIPSVDLAQPDHHPFFIIPSILAKVLHCIAPSYAQFRGALVNLGYRVTRSHTKPGSMKTDAPWSVIWEIMREWVRQKAPVKPGAIKKGTAGWGIMQKGRSRACILGLKTELEDIVMTAENVEIAKTQLEAVLYRMTKDQDDTTEEKKPLDVIFDEQLGKETGGKRLVRYQLNPTANWGPMSRAKGGDAPSAVGARIA
ncbi:RNA methyltransferase tRNA(m5U54)methyltransferase [Ptychographa xylographoides]|nr:RNA methyltransferase tRNA(m5U54)methyltransferase [Ptychographa xylographoides]